MTDEQLPHPKTSEIEERYAYDEWDVDLQEEEAPRRERFRRWYAAEIRKARAEAIREAVKKDAITIPDILGHKVQAVAVEDLLNRVGRIDGGRE